MARAIVKLNFQQHPKSLNYKKSRKTRYRCRHVVVFNCQTVRKKDFAKGYARLHGTNIFKTSKETSIWEIRIVPEVGC